MKVFLSSFKKNNCIRLCINICKGNHKLATEENCDLELIFDMFHQELTLACQAFFAWKAIHNLLSNDRKLYNSFNRNALSWNLIMHSLQATFFITLGRIFDTDQNSFSVHKVFRCCKKEIHQFNREGLRSRRLENEKEIPDWLDGYINEAYEAKSKDFTKLKKEVNKVQRIYEDIYRPIRHKIFAHKDYDHLSNTAVLFKETTIGQAENILKTLYQAKMVIRSLYDNGRHSTIGSWELKEEEYVHKDIESLLNKIKGI